MRFLIDACLPRDFAPVIVSYGHVAVDVRDVGLGQAADPVIASYAKSSRVCLLTEDWGFADIRTYPPADYSGVVIFETVDQGIEEKLTTLKSLLDQDEIVKLLPERLAIVSARKIRLRPPR